MNYPLRQNLGCGALFNTELVKDQKNAQKERAEQAKA